MTVEEIKESIERSTPAERMYFTALLKHLGRKDDAAYKSELSRLNNEIDDGKKLSFDQAKRLHETLKSEGL